MSNKIPNGISESFRGSLTYLRSLRDRNAADLMDYIEAAYGADKVILVERFMEQPFVKHRFRRIRELFDKESSQPEVQELEIVRDSSLRIALLEHLLCGVPIHDKPELLEVVL